MTVAEEAQWLQHTVGVCILRDQVVVRVAGSDAREWLNGQVTQKISEQPEPDTSTYAMIVDLKGRVSAEAWVLDRDTEFWLLLPKQSEKAVLETFDRYIIMEDVEIETIPSSILTAQGPLAEQILPHGWPTDRLGLGGRESIIPRGAANEHFDSLVTEARGVGGGPVEEQGWELARIRRGRPRFGVDFGNWTYPQETGLKSLAVSFTKGCYIGQEAVVMLEHRGNPPKRLCTFELGASPADAVNAEVIKDAGKAGTITSAATDSGKTIAIGAVLRGHIEPGAAFTVAGAPATLTRVIGE